MYDKCMYPRQKRNGKIFTNLPGKDDWIWDDLHAVAEKLTTKDDNGEYKTFGFQAQSWSYAVSTYLESLGLSYVSDDYSTADGYLNSQEMADVLDTYFGWAEGDDRISPTSAETDTYGDGTAMMITVSWHRDLA